MNHLSLSLLPFVTHSLKEPDQNSEISVVILLLSENAEEGHREKWVKTLTGKGIATTIKTEDGNLLHLVQVQTILLVD